MKLKTIKIKGIYELQELYINSYSPVFSQYWKDNGMKQYLDQESDYDRLKLEIQDTSITYYFIEHNNINVGIIKMKFKSSDEFSKLNNCEIEKMYILPKYSGQGIGKMALTELLNKLKRKKKNYFSYLLFHLIKLPFYFMKN